MAEARPRRLAALAPRGSDPDAPTSRRVSEDERRSRLDEQLRNMAGAPTRRRRRVIKPLSKTPTPQPAAAEFTEATFDDEGECPSDGCSTEAAAPSEEEEMVANAFRARNVRGYQSDRHSTESAHERINSQLAGLHRKKVIRARADGVDLDRETKKETSRSAARRDGSEHVVKDETNSARFYGGVGLQLEESTPERFPSPGEAREGMARGKVHVRRHLQRGRHQTISQGTLASGGGGCIPRRVRVSRERIIASYHSVRVVAARSRRSTKRRFSRELEYISRGVVERGVRSLSRAPRVTRHRFEVHGRTNARIYACTSEE